MRTLINIIILITLTYACMRVLDNALLFNHGSLTYYFYLCAPWALFYGSLKAWKQSFIWRRMLEDRYSVPNLSRGKYQFDAQHKQSRFLERICVSLFFLSIAAILKIFDVENIIWWIGSLGISVLIVHIALMGVSRP